MKKLIILLFLSILACTIQAQNHQRAVGIRGGISSGVEYRVFTSDRGSYKALLSTRDEGLQLVALKEFHEFGLFDCCDQLSLVYGFGIHAGYEHWDKSVYDSGFHHWESRTAPIAGLDALVALEYNIEEIPLSIGIEGKPFFDMLGRKFFRLQPFDFGFTVKYNF